jgi:D-alanyl-D-alanine carboxypeptidase
MVFRSITLSLITILSVCFTLCANADGKNPKKRIIPRRSGVYIARKLMEAYPDFIIGFAGNSIIWKDSSEMKIGETPPPESFSSALTNPCLADQFAQKYPKGVMPTSEGPEKFHDPGRIRYESFFYKMYGENENRVRKNLVEVVWCPKLVGQKILVTTINGVDKKIKAISRELDRHPEFKKYVTQIGGTFCWRNIAGSNRQSAHSFGTTIDLNTDCSNYWQWDCHCTDESADISYRNRIPAGIVEIFEKYGFIWGGKWYHYDTMHFEYRPELL